MGSNRKEVVEKMWTKINSDISVEDALQYLEVLERVLINIEMERQLMELGVL